jgi:hypothetical protein
MAPGKEISMHKHKKQQKVKITSKSQEFLNDSEDKEADKIAF